MESNKLNKIKKGAIGFLLCLLFLPLVQYNLNIFRIHHLGGWITWAGKPTFYLHNWFSGDYQKEQEAYANQQFGFRSELVRLNNQLDYWLYNQANAKGIIYADSGILHDRLYTDAFYGMNYIGDKKVDSIADQIKQLQDLLAKDGKTFLMVFAAGKATYYEEYIPKQYRLPKKKTNYLAFAEAMKKRDINHIDFNKWFLDNKKKSKHPLFPQLGIHWSIYGSALAFDSIERYLEKKRNIDMPDFKITAVETPDTLRSPDDDIYQAVNLIFDIPHYKMAYPVIKVEGGASKVKPTLITIGDSFWWNIYNFGVNDEVFNQGQFWYYDKDRYRGGSTEIRHKEDMNTNTEIAKADIIILCYTEATIHDIGSGFLDELHTYYKTAHTTKQQDIDNFSKYIRGDKAWMERLTNKSKETGIPLDSLIYRDAKWQADNLPPQ